MTKLYLNSSNIDNYVIDNLRVAINNLNYAINWIGVLNIPEDFTYAQYLKQINNKNANSMDTLSSYKQTLNNKVKALKKMEKENTLDFSEIGILNIRKRNGLK